MTTIVQSSHDQLVHEVADDYIRQGFPVSIEPSDADLPDFLKGFRPDMIVKTPSESIVVEVKSRGKVRQADYWSRLESAIKSQPGWSFQFVLNNRREAEIADLVTPVLSEQEVSSRLRAGQDLAEKGLLDSALLIVWSALEAVLWKMSRNAGLKLPNQGPAALITNLFTEGDLERSDYEALTRILRLRNQAAHGFSTEGLRRSTLDETLEIARRLLSHQHQHSGGTA